MQIIEGSTFQNEPADREARWWDFWCVAKDGNNKYVTTAELKQHNGYAAADLLVSATVAHPYSSGITALLPLLSIHYPLTETWNRSSSDVSEHRAAYELEILITQKLSGLLADIQYKGGIPRLPGGPLPSSGRRELEMRLDRNRSKYQDVGQAKRISSRDATKEFRLAIGDFHFKKSRIEDDLAEEHLGFTAIDLRVAAYFNFLKAIGYLDVRAAVGNYMKSFKQTHENVNVEIEGLENEEHSHSIFVQTMLTRLSKKGLILNTRAF